MTQPNYTDKNCCECLAKGSLQRVEVWDTATDKSNGFVGRCHYCGALHNLGEYLPQLTEADRKMPLRARVSDG